MLDDKTELSLRRMADRIDTKATELIGIAEKLESGGDGSDPELHAPELHRLANAIQTERDLLKLLWRGEKP